MFDIDPTTLSDTRIQLHWASQVLCAAADAALEKAEDDSHSNLGWDGASGTMIGRAGFSIRIGDFSLTHADESMSLNGQTLLRARDWVAERLNTILHFRDYEMPPHAVKDGAPFAADLDQLNEIVEWFSFANRALAGHGELRTWPHHFDMGFWQTSTVEGKSIGGGFSLGDDNYDQPYFYVNPYGIDRPEVLPELPIGDWSEKWFGAVLTASRLLENESREKAAQQFVTVASSHCSQLLGI